MTKKEKTRLSEHFADWEFRCRCGCGSMWVDWGLVEALEELRGVLGSPVHILSGCRCRRHNEVVGGKENSRHLTQANGSAVPCRAADIYIAGQPVRNMFRAARAVPAFLNGGIGVYPGEGFIHVDIRKGKARWQRTSKGAPHTKVERNLY